MPAPARLRARRPQRPHVADPCPLCRADLGGPGGATRRVVVWTAEPGVFVWRCPQCDGAWAEDADGPLLR